MKRHPTRPRAAVLTLAIGSLLTAGCHNGALRPSETVADSVSGFSGEQGANGWSYGYWDRTADNDQRYRPEDFQLFQHFGSDPINGLSVRDDFTTGNQWLLQDGVYYTALWAEGGSANGTTKLASQAKVEHWAVRRWVSPVSGSVTVSGHAAKLAPWGRGGDVHIVVDGVTIFSAALDQSLERGPEATDMRGTNYSVNATVHAGSLVDFLIGTGKVPDGSAFGPVTFTATIRTAP